jgi:tetratricopeptide (TPR) repeat protein
VRCEEALPLLIEVSDRNGQADTWDSLGYAHHHLGRHAAAVTCYWRAVALYRQLGDHFREATTFINLGDAHTADGNTAGARHAWQQALAILEQLEHPDAAGVRGKLAAQRPQQPSTAGVR